MLLNRLLFFSVIASKWTALTLCFSRRLTTQSALHFTPNHTSFIHWWWGVATQGTKPTHQRKLPIHTHWWQSHRKQFGVNIAQLSCTRTDRHLGWRSQGIEPLIFWLVDDLLHLLSHSHKCQPHLQMLYYFGSVVTFSGHCPEKILFLNFDGWGERIPVINHFTICHCKSLFKIITQVIIFHDSFLFIF